MTILDERTILEYDNYKLTLVDCRNRMDDAAATQEYLRAMAVPNSVHIPQEPWMFDRDGLNRGRHPIPTRHVVASLHEALKTGDGNHLLLFDDDMQFFHTRLYFLFRLYGLEALLWNGPLSYIEKNVEYFAKAPELPAELPTTHDRESDGSSMLASMEEVQGAVADDSVLLIDVRSRPRYLGREEPIDFRKGHIPGAVNIPYPSIFKEGRMDFDALEHLRQDLESFREVIVYCGSGMSATPPYLVLESMGLPVKLYGGSFSEWITDETNTIEMGDSSLNERIVH